MCSTYLTFIPKRAVHYWYLRVIFERRSRGCLHTALLLLLLDAAPLDDRGQVHQGLAQTVGWHSSSGRSPESEHNTNSRVRACCLDLSHHFIHGEREGELPAHPVDDVTNLGKRKQLGQSLRGFLERPMMMLNSGASMSTRSHRKQWALFLWRRTAICGTTLHLASTVFTTTRRHCCMAHKCTQNINTHSLNSLVHRT